MSPARPPWATKGPTLVDPGARTAVRSTEVSQ